MFKAIQNTYDFSDYQIAQLKYFFLTFFSEISKILLIGLFFLDNIFLYVWALFILQIIRSSSGGIHCKTYWRCFFVSLIYMVLSIRILPLIYINKFFQMITLLICITTTYYIGPITSVFHPVLTDLVKKKLKIKLFYIIFFYLTLLYIMPKNLCMDIGYWVIILNTLQLTVAKLCRKEPL